VTTPPAQAGGFVRKVRALTEASAWNRSFLPSRHHAERATNTSPAQGNILWSQHCTSAEPLPPPVLARCRRLTSWPAITARAARSLSRSKPHAGAAHGMPVFAMAGPRSRLPHHGRRPPSGCLLTWVLGIPPHALGSCQIGGCATIWIAHIKPIENVLVARERSTPMRFILPWMKNVSRRGKASGRRWASCSGGRQTRSCYG